MPENTVSVTRPGPWGNPFQVTAAMTAEQSVAHFKRMLRYETLAVELEMPVQSAHMRWIALNIDKLKGKNLACWCPVGQPCHADVLLQVANWKP